ncbi:luciferase [Mycobacterium saskatchewanense]|uniref:Luciferase n=1 Tax=Mycobacterium saskatchewanense TaxID=220927 RepID=A0AAJ3TUR4_9MYCO|nr:LLM class flavin-dependent oxidoreductase [Mycobacterium saskatchewanense]ORW65116.1 luciferase [Mycobacterium saskatchewanense]BBX65206.1 luciferase [Mycobacterium saskatchewanense]
MELGVYSFAEMTRYPDGGRPIPPEKRVSEIIEEIELADQVGLDVYGLGEHHRRDFAVSNPAVVLAAAAARTHRIRLTSAATIISSDDPVRVFQEFATLDLVSGGRAEIMAGRGAFTESFPLFGYRLEDYDAVFREKLDLLLQLRNGGPITWSGKFRPALSEQTVFPPPVQQPLPVWLAVGGTLESAQRAGSLGLPMAIGIIAGDIRRFIALAELYRRVAAHSGNSQSARISINSHGYVATSMQRAVDDTYPAFLEGMHTFTGTPRHLLPSRERYARESEKNGALIAGTPEQVAEKILYQHRLFGHDRTLLQLSVGTLPHRQVLDAIELLGTQVAPLVRSELG